MPVIGAKSIRDMTRKEFEELPHRESWDEEVECNSLILLPTRRLHDSGYRCIDMVACQDDIAFCRVAGGSDVVNIEGIGGFGYRWADREGASRFLVAPAGWSIDCLKKSGLLRIFPSVTHRIRVGLHLSNLEIWSIADERRGGNAAPSDEGSPRRP